jgi:glycosyltransferase involved in cell wall biosynthesis
VDPKILVGIPAFNEERSIASVVARSLPHASAVVVIDDGSRDRTAANALHAGATVIHHPVNAGKGIAVATLFDYAIEQNADVLILIDGDGQHDPEEIPSLARMCLASEADVVVGSRFHAQAISRTPRVRRLGQIAFNAMTAVASGVYCSDSQSGFRAFNRRAFCSMRVTERSFSVESEMQFEFRAKRLRVAEVPISCSYDDPPKRNVLLHGMTVLTRLMRMAIERRALGLAPATSMAIAPSNKVVLNHGELPLLDSVLITTPGD